MKIEKGKLIKTILKKCIYIITILCFLYNIAFSINTTINQKDYLKIFGISLFNMESDLMQDDINSGDLVIVKNAEKQELQEEDIIAYTVNGKTRINKIFKIKQDEYVTKSNKNYNPDIEKIKHNQLIGKMVARTHVGGTIIGILQSQTTTGLILIFLVIYFWYNKYLFAKKQERAKKKNG